MFVLGYVVFTNISSLSSCAVCLIKKGQQVHPLPVTGSYVRLGSVVTFLTSQIRADAFPMSDSRSRCGLHSLCSPWRNQHVRPGVYHFHHLFFWIIDRCVHC